MESLVTQKHLIRRRKLFYPVISIVFFASIRISQNENRIEDSKGRYKR